MTMRTFLQSMVLWSLAVMIAACDSRTQSSLQVVPAEHGVIAAQPTAVTNVLATEMAELPLRRGFYVASDTRCEDASNATLVVLRRGGMGGARDFCEFKRIEQIDSDVYRVVEACGDVLAPSSVEEGTVTYTLRGDSGFDALSEHGWSTSFRRCEQSSLPDEWRDIEIQELLD